MFRSLPLLLILFLAVLISGCTSRRGQLANNSQDLRPSPCAKFTKGSKGPAEITPIRVFDDSLWTYFQFGEENLDHVQNLPVLYIVKDGVDRPVNTRQQNGTGFLIGETVSERWTLWSGDKYLCIFRGKKEQD